MSEQTCTLELDDADCVDISHLIRHEINYHQVTNRHIREWIAEDIDEQKRHPDRKPTYIMDDHVKSLKFGETALADYITLNEKLMQCGCKRATNWEGKIPGD